jgi:ribonuclease P protein component
MTAGRPDRLLRRSEFLAVSSQARKWVTPGMIVQVMPRPDSGQIRYGLTASRKVGGAVQRNRARRRLRALAEALLSLAAFPPADVVLIARTATITRPFAQLQADLLQALARLKP